MHAAGLVTAGRKMVLRSVRTAQPKTDLLTCALCGGPGGAPSTLLQLRFPATMEGPLKELTKLEQLTSFSPSSSHASSSSGKAKSTQSIADSLDHLLYALRDIKERLEAGTASEEDVGNVWRIVEERKKEIDDRQKEIHATLGKVGKAIDKVRRALQNRLLPSEITCS